MIYGWKETYQSRLSDAVTALKRIRKGSRIFIGSACGEPQLLVKTLIELAPQMYDTEVYHFLDLGNSEYAEDKYSEHFRHNALFIGQSTRKAVEEGRADYTPVFLSEIPNLMQRRKMRIDVALIQVSPPDKNGYVSLGISVDITKTAAETARYVVAEVNASMPRTHGDSFLHVNEIDAFVENDQPLIEFQSESPTEIIEKIGSIIADLIENESCIQTGIGKIPNSVLPYLMNKKDLGVHTEVFTDSLIDLIEAGVINNRKKNINTGKIVSAFCMGSRKLYDYVDDNPLFEFRPCSYVNSSGIIRRNDRCTAINSALTVDITGQICSDSLGFRFYSGIGGQSDFVRGARMANRGRSIMTLPSTTDDGTKSRIVPFLDPGSGVVITRASVNYVVTEYGYAYIHGKTIRERALALISIAHPKFRDWLLDCAKDQGYIYKDQILPSAIYPREYESWWKDKKGDEVFFRPARPTDERAIQDLVYSLPDQDVYTRFFQNLRNFPHKLAMPMAAIDYSDKMAIVGVMGNEAPDRQEQIIALGHYVRDPVTNNAEVAFTIHHDYQNMGIGSFLLNHLCMIAVDRNIRGFTADVLARNTPMMKVFSKTGYPLKVKLEYGVYELEIPFEEGKKENAGS
jgi:acyl-CoA hydrolase/GNAT superfamily N-acetyltransferase